ncbi:MAG: RsmB/NOP family class I SAM-dependent RNA methyltransferase [Flavobacteriales bacterium]|nr:RsmB/NOP family class I SAM-dependent RNA methyltransferase [Flavobacteriales bacterium]
MNLPPEFIERIKKQLGHEADHFFAALHHSPPVSIRIHPRKFPKAHVWNNLPQVPWCKEGIYLTERPVFTLDPLFHAGAYYVQEASSMVISYILNQLQTPEKASLRVLDLCAAPGGKSTLLSSWLNGDGLLISNEVIRSRIPALKENTIRWGYDNVIITNNDPADFINSELLFDIVVVDAPCSGEGLFRKDTESIFHWSVENTQLCTLRQKRILEAATEIVEEGGYLLYSTCTYNPNENELHRQQIIDSGFEPVVINIPSAWNITQLSDNSMQFYPHKNKGEGFYIAVFKKIKPNSSKATFGKKNKLEIINTMPYQSWINLPDNRKLIRTEKISAIIFPDAWLDWLAFATNKLRIVHAGIEVGEIKGKDYILSHALAMSLFINKEVKTLEVDEFQARLFLSKESLVLPESIPHGYILISFQQIPLGWLKNLGNRSNNLYPQEFRIRMRWK